MADLDHCLAFNPVRITPYGTLEIRSTCQQPLEDIFTPVAFQVAIRHCADELLSIMPKTWAQHAERLRSHANLNHPMAYAKQELIPKLLKTMVDSLAQRNYGEEKYLDVLFERYYSRSNPAIDLAKIKSKRHSVTKYILETSISN